MQIKSFSRFISLFVLISLVISINPVAYVTVLAASAQTTTDFTFTPVADTYVNARKSKFNFGNSTSLRTDASPVVDSYLRFIVQGLSGQVSQARLMIYANSSSTKGLVAQAVADNSWGETTLNYKNAPALGNTLATSPAVLSGTWVTLDVTSYIIGNGTFSFGVTTPDSNAISLESRESGANSPKLIISTNGSSIPAVTSTLMDVNAATPVVIPPSPTATVTSVVIPPSPTATAMAVNTATPVVIPPSPTATVTSVVIPPSPTATASAINTATPVVISPIPSPTVTPVITNAYYVSTTGNDANPGTQTQPWRTILKATNSLKSGDTAFVLSGTYNEPVNVSTSGITLQAQGKVITKNVYISGDSNTFRGFTITDPSSDWGIRTSGNHLLIENNEIYHTKQDGIWFFGSYNTFRGNYIHDILWSDTVVTHSDCFQTWSWDWDTTNVLFEKNTCIHNETVNLDNEFFTAFTSTSIKVGDITFRNNLLVIYTPIWAAFYIDANVPNLIFENNTIVNMSQGGNNVVADVTGRQDVYFINNLFINWGSTNTYQPYLVTNGEAHPNIHNNNIYNYYASQTYKGALPGDMMVDPKVVDFSNLNFHLQSNSPLINAGYNLGNLVPNDIDGNTRPQGTGYDIGAYEFPAP